MLKKISVILSICLLIIILPACSNNEENGNYYDYYEEPEPTPEELRAAFELFFEENKESIIEAIATEGEDVRLELAAGYEFIMTIILDDIELNDENRALYILTFELTFLQMMSELFSELAFEIKEDAQIDHFRLSVIFVDVNEVEISRSSFDARVDEEPIYEIEENGEEEV